MLNWQEASEIYESLAAIGHTEQTPLGRLWHEMRHAAVRYATMRVRAALAGADTDHSEFERERTLAHDVFIDSCNAMSRAMVAEGLDPGWRMQLGDHRTRQGRKTIGDFACFLHCMLGLSTR